MSSKSKSCISTLDREQRLLENAEWMLMHKSCSELGISGKAAAHGLLIARMNLVQLSKEKAIAMAVATA